MPAKPPTLILNAFEMACAGHICHGLWSHPRDETHRFGELAYWEEVARTLEEGMFDGIFFADGLGVYDVYRGDYEIALREGIQVPRLDPMLIVPTMAHATRHLGFGITSSVTYEPPYLFARRMSTLDQLTGGRVGWNVVTGYLDSAAKGVGLGAQPGHDDRYDRADDYMDAVYGLWEGSWDDGAVRLDRAGRTYVDPARVRRVVHDGPFHRVDAPHLCAPTPQRTPVLYQAGASDRGRRFAARHAECVFVMGPNRAVVAGIVHDLRRAVEEEGRDPYAVRVLAGLNIVVGATDAEARDRLAEYRLHASPEAGLAHFSATVGIDFSAYALDEPIRYAPNEGGRSALEAFTRRGGGKVWTVRELLDAMPLGSRVHTFVGSPEAVADELQAWRSEANVDGLNLIRTVAPESFRDFARLVVPVLQERGLVGARRAEGTLQRKLFGEADVLPASHYGSRFRGDGGRGRPD
ncbi:LLM class flavin-dependent oxidoreductase [Methylobacterium pseudosasicola]|uniref:FMN-dependent oxidoreductase, nitrilotriacetate monooxygenase family n=1 Tax=Methylobacterium pseudosasicola TaxID=582667 RepID=A0A1I4UM01_9HYPH|nr:LLM class flavin-dependent oxidoreductase [Methylobacterium pseudosasicola]SFM89941.1 FMN-dependent oxidoreductase, nitrilotriacetate monooxygenase family [Methylobacterium pseudosasicola]